MFAAVLFALCTVSLTCRPWSAAPEIVTHDWSLSTYVSPTLFNIDRRLLFNTDGSSIFKPRRNHSHHAAFSALLLLLGGVETNPGPAVKLRAKSASAKDTAVTIGCLNCRSAANKTAVIHDLISDNNLDVRSYLKHGLIQTHRRRCGTTSHHLDTLRFTSSDLLVQLCHREAVVLPPSFATVYQYAFIHSPTTIYRLPSIFNCSESTQLAHR